MAATPEEVAHIAGERGNPWVLPSNPGHITIKQTTIDNQFGICGLARPERFPILADVYFMFLADTTSNWNFLILANFHGYYILNAVRGFLLCRDSRVTLDVSINASQYFSFGEKSTNLLNEESDTGFRYGLYDESLRFDYSAPLRADPQYHVVVRMRVTIHADAYGGYAQINFADGANYVDPLILVASPT
jgi:hypothetical protein